MDPSDPLTRRATDARLHRLHEADVLDDAAWSGALISAVRTPSAAGWIRYLATVQLLVGAALITSGLVYLVAYNWSELGRFGQFALCGAWIVVAFAFALAYGPTTLRGRVGLTVATVGVGAWLAVIGQTYQTGAHDWSLFAMWAGIAVPWALVARAPGLWMLVIVIANVAFGRFTPLVSTWESLAPLLYQAALQGVVLLAWTAGARIEPALRVRWVPRVVAAALFGLLLVPAIVWIVAPSEAPWPAGVGAIALGLLCAGVAVRTQLRQGDLFATTLAGGSVLIAANVWLGDLLFDQLEVDFELGALIVAIAVLAQAGAFVAWSMRFSSDPAEEVDS